MGRNLQTKQKRFLRFAVNFAFCVLLKIICKSWFHTWSCHDFLQLHLSRWGTRCLKENFRNRPWEDWKIVKIWISTGHSDAFSTTSLLTQYPLATLPLVDLFFDLRFFAILKLRETSISAKVLVGFFPRELKDLLSPLSIVSSTRCYSLWNSFSVWLDWARTTGTLIFGCSRNFQC